MPESLAFTFRSPFRSPEQDSEISALRPFMPLWIEQL